MWRKFVFPFLFILVIIIVMETINGQMKESEILNKEAQQPTPISPSISHQFEQYEELLERPKIGLSTYVSHPIEEWVEKYGEPSRIEPSLYAYRWYVYPKMRTMVGVNDDGTINQIYTMNEQLNTEPYRIDDSVEHVLSTAILNTEVAFQHEDNQYIFTLTQEDIQERLLLAFQQLNMQIYFDVEEEKIEAIRFIDDATLLLHQPYDLYYEGTVSPRPPVSSEQSSDVYRATERQLVDLSNWLRLSHARKKLETDYSLTVFARRMSEQFALSALTEEKADSLPNRLKQFNIKHEKAGENTAFSSGDAIEVMHGFLNSPEHRKVMLSDQYTHIGASVYGNYYVLEYIYKTPDPAEYEEMN